MIKKISLFLITCLLLSVQSAEAANQSLYANLVKDENGKYTITEITSRKNSIDLRNLSPVGFDSSVIDCSTTFFGSSGINDNANKCNPDSSEFRTKKIRLGPTVLLGITTFGISLLLGVVKVESVFDYDAFDRAVAEALVNSGVSGNRTAFVERYTRIRNQTKVYDKSLDNLFMEYNDNYRVSAHPIEKTIEDRSGFLNRDDIYFEILVKVNRKKVGDLKPKPYQLPDFAAAPKDFDNKMTEYEEDLKAAFKNNTDNFEKKFREATSTYDVSCGPVFMKPYHLSYECPETIPSNPDPAAEFTAKIIVLSKDFDGVFPLYTAENGDLKVTFTKNRVAFENKTKSVLKIRSVTVRYNDKVSTFGTADRYGSYEVMPMKESDTVIPVKKILSYEVEKAADYKEVSKETAETTKLNFGMDIKYSIGDTGLEHSLSGGKEYRLSEVL
ncbi:MAG: hypothetical protein HY891_01630 [Deltaproteobacteria bacterium]|nr:hypothetical protein [Deltaproteobacteria bacterium]